MGLPLGVLVIHVVASLAVVAVARVASREHVLGAAEGAPTRARLRRRGLWGLRSGRELDDLVVGVTTVSGERRRWEFRGRRRSMLLLLLLLLRLPLLLLLRLFFVFDRGKRAERSIVLDIGFRHR